MQPLRFFVLAFLCAVILSISVSANSCPAISDIVLTGPADNYVTGDVHTTVDFSFYQENFPGNASNCYVQLWDATTPSQTYPASPQQVLTPYNEITDLSLVNPPAINPLSGVYYWNVFCADNSTGTCTNATYAANRTIIFDTQGPLVTTTDTADMVFENATRTFNFTPVDNYDGGSFGCGLYLDGVLAGTTTVFNGTLGEITATAPSQGTISWYVSCLDDYGNVGNSTALDYIYDTDTMTIDLSDAPSDGYVESFNATVYYNVSVTDEYSPTGLNCSLYVDDTYASSQIIASGGTANLSNTYTENGDFDWQVTCYDPFGNSQSSATRVTTIDVGPNAPVLWTLPSVLSSLWLDVVGLLDKFASITITAQNDQNGSFYQNTTTTFEFPNETQSLGSATISFVFPSGNTTFNTADTAFATSGNLTTSNYLAFANHNRTNFSYYDIVSVTTFPTYATIQVTPPFEEIINVGERFYVYDKPYPTGWFSVSVDLFDGNNAVSIIGQRDGVFGDELSTSVFVDSLGPSISTTLGNVTSLNDSITINITDNYNVSLTSLVINATNGTHNFSIVTDNSLYNVSLWNVTPPNATCIASNLTDATCTWNVNLTDGVYNLTLFATDYLGSTSSITLTNITVRSTVAPVPSIVHVDGVTTINAQFNVSWNASPDPFLAYYQVAVGSAPGQEDVVAWFNVSISENQTLIVDDAIIYGQIYYVSIRPIDESGLAGATTSTELIYTQDGTVPVVEYVSITSGVGGWITSNSNLQLNWSFIDNETGIDFYEYAIGTTNVSIFTGWNDVLTAQQTANTQALETGLSLEQGENYYLSVRAKNNYPFSAMYSPWVSSSPVTVDSLPPTGVSISYAADSYTVSSIDLSYSTGTDAVSGVSTAALRYRRAALSGDVCQGYGGWQVVNASLSLSSTPTAYTYGDLDSGYCYQFGVRVHDVAGNQIIVNGPTASAVAVDITPPGAVAIDATPGVISTNNLSFTWSVAEENESQVSYYLCGLGTSPGATDTSGWLNCSQSPTVTLTNLSLADGTIYYFSVRPYNSFGLGGSVSTSLGMLYFDVSIPQALTVTQVGADTQAPWLDVDDTVNWTIIELEGESALNCVWSYFDIPYTNPSASYATACTESSGTYYCNVTNLVEGTYSASVSCADTGNNAQSVTQNTDIVFSRELSAPVIEFLTPASAGTVYSPNTNLSVVTNITDISSYVATYTISQVATGTTLASGSLINDSFVLNLGNFSGETRITVLAVDAYAHSATAETTFFVTTGEPQHVVLSNITSGLVEDTLYTNQNFTFENYYYFVNETGSRIQNSTNVFAEYTTVTSQASIADKINVNTSVNVSALADGAYTFAVNASGAVNTTAITRNYTFVIDTVDPEFDFTGLEVNTSEITESASAVGFIIAVNESDMRPTALFNYSIGGQNYSQTATALTPRDWRPNESRYQASVPSYHLVANETLFFTWFVTDLAGNTNSVLATDTIENQEPIISNQSLGTALAGTAFYQVINFTDLDTSQNTFTCEQNTSIPSLSIAHVPSTRTCLLTWTTPTTGVYNITVQVTDTSASGFNQSTVAQNFTLEAVNNTAYDFNLDTNVFDFAVAVEQGTDYVVPTQSFSPGSASVQVPQTSAYTVRFSRPEVSIQGSNLNTANVSLFFRKNQTTLAYAPDDLGLGREYVPLRGFAINMSPLPLNSSPNRTFSISFNYTDFGFDDSSSADLRIFKYDYDEASETILYGGSGSQGLISSTRNTATDTISVVVTSFSAFVIAQDVPTCSDDEQNQGEDGVDCGGPCSPSCPSSGGGSSGGGGGGFTSSAVTPAPTCEDGIKNQNEVQIDCGGVCGACSEPVVFASCTDGILNQDEVKVDCGGSCPSCVAEASCFDRVRNQNEVQVDCGGVCGACVVEESAPEEPEQQFEPQLQSPEQSSLFSNPYLYGILGFVLVGAFVVIAIEAPRKARPSTTTKAILAAEKQPEQENLVHFVQKVYRQNLQDKDSVTIKMAMKHAGFSEMVIDRGLYALDQKKQLQSLVKYFETYSAEGYSLEEMLNWLSSQGIDQDLLAVSVGMYKQHSSF